MAKSRVGGGPSSKQVKQVSLRPGTPNRAFAPGGVSQIGQSIAKNPEPMNAGKALQSKMGNEIAAQTVCAPGGSRTVQRTGTQGQHGSGGPAKPAGRDIFADFPPSKNR